MKQPNILIMGGTYFVGRVLVEQLQKAGFKSVTLFNRGKTNPDLFPNYSLIKGDRRTDDIQQLKDTHWDVVVDCSSYYPDPLQSLLSILKKNCGHYIYVSTISVYDNSKKKDPLAYVVESDPLLCCTLEEREDKTMATYGKKKVACEAEVIESGIPYTIFRPSVIYGSYDPFDRHYYWLYRIQQSKEILVPNDNFFKSSFTYVKDFAELMIEAIKSPPKNDIYNVTTHEPMSIVDLVKRSAEALDKNPKLLFVDQLSLQKLEVRPWADISLWTGSDVCKISNDKLQKDFKASFTPFADSIRASFGFYEEKDLPRPTYGISLVQEVELIKKALEIM